MWFERGLGIGEEGVDPLGERELGGGSGLGGCVGAAIAPWERKRLKAIVRKRIKFPILERGNGGG